MTKKKNTTPQKTKTKQARNTSATQAEQIEAALELLKPQINFHKALEDASQHDVRMLWDVRVVQGKDTPFSHVHGSTSFPAMLAPNMLATAPEKIQQAVIEKIVLPLTAVVMAASDKATFEGIARREAAKGHTSEEECYAAADGETP